MKLVYLLDVTEDHVALSPERLRNVLPHQLRNIILLKTVINVNHDISKIRCDAYVKRYEAKQLPLLYTQETLRSPARSVSFPSL